MSQSALLVGLLAAAFVLYLAAKGRLPAYTAVLWGKPAQPSGRGSGGGGSSVGDTVAKAADYLPEALAFIGG